MVVVVPVVISSIGSSSFICNISIGGGRSGCEVSGGSSGGLIKLTTKR